jgi:hypothetical protein
LWGLLSSWRTRERAATKTIGSERLLFLGGAIETISQGDPRSRRSLALIVALVLTAGVFAFFGGEARAQQSPQQPHAAVADTEGDPLTETVEEVAGRAAGASPVDILLAEAPLAQMLPAEAFPVSVAPLAEEPPDGPGRVDPALRQDPTPTTFGRYDTGATPLGLAPERGIPGDPRTTRVPGPLPVPEAVPAPPAGERPSVNAPANTPAAGAHPATLPRNGAAGAVPVGPTPSTAVRGTPPVALVPGSLPVGHQSPPSPEVAVSSATENLQSIAANVADTMVSTHASGGGSSPATSSSGAGDAPESTPQHERRPSSPLAPLGGSSFSLSGGQAGPGGGLAPLLVCVLASGLVLLRRDGLLFRWAPYEPLKPSSALLLPLERPG